MRKYLILLVIIFIKNNLKAQEITGYDIRIRYSYMFAGTDERQWKSEKGVKHTCSTRSTGKKFKLSTKKLKPVPDIESIIHSIDSLSKVDEIHIVLSSEIKDSVKVRLMKDSTSSYYSTRSNERYYKSKLDYLEKNDTCKIILDKLTTKYFYGTYIQPKYVECTFIVKYVDKDTLYFQYIIPSGGFSKRSVLNYYMISFLNFKYQFFTLYFKIGSDLHEYDLSFQVYEYLIFSNEWEQ